jgi:hypothetical protein
MGMAFFTVGIEAWHRGDFLPQFSQRPPTASEIAFAAEIDPDLPAALVPIMLGTWAHFHGLVTLEVLNQYDWMYGSNADTFFEGELDRMLTSLDMGP